MATLEQDALSYIKGLFPWLQELGVRDEELFEIAVQDLPDEGIVAEIRKLPSYERATAGIRNADGSMRMLESEFFARREELRTVLRNRRPESEWDDPEDFRAFFDAGITEGRELEQRFDLYDSITKSPNDVRDAFYVYAGRQMTDDELYGYFVNPTVRQQLDEEYNIAVTTAPVDYQTWLERATQVGLSRVVSILEQLQAQGAVTQTAIAAVRNIDPSFAAQMADAIYRGGADDRFLTLPELMSAVEYALIGGAALGAGLELPDEQRIESFRQAGINRQQALQGYDTIASRQGILSGAAMRANLAARGFTQADLEDAIFLSRADQAELLRRAQRFEESLGITSGAPRVTLSPRGGYQQAGLYGG